MNVAKGSYVETAFLGNTSTLELVQIHWHHSSEHRLNNVSFAVETHLVTKAVESGRSICMMATDIVLCMEAISGAARRSYIQLI